ncbi:hypothetical protein SALBM135S_08491 [Streptomyces alboniger]
MVLACDQPAEARRFYEEMTGAPLHHADFRAARGPGASTPQWELAVGVGDPDSVVARARDHGQGLVAWSEEAGRRVVRVSSPEGLTFQVHPWERWLGQRTVRCRR